MTGFGIRFKVGVNTCEGSFNEALNIHKNGNNIETPKASNAVYVNILLNISFSFLI